MSDRTYTDQAFLDRVVLESRILFRQTTSFRITGLCLRDQLEAFEFAAAIDRSGETFLKMFDGGIPDNAKIAFLIFPDCIEPELLALRVVEGYLIAIFAEMLVVRGHASSVEEWKLGRGAGARVTFEKREVHAAEVTDDRR